MSKHTPGPWALKPHGVIVGGLFLQFPRGESQSQLAMATILTGSDAESPAEERDANARLIAAAPDLLAALQELADIAGCLEPTCNADKTAQERRIDRARAAIAKATGDPA